VYYAITKKGLTALLLHVPDPIKFWEILYRYRLNTDSAITLDEFEGFYQIAMRKYLKYPFHGYSFQLDIFDDLCNKIQETIVKSDSITPLQKVVEILALYPKITLKELVERTEEPEECIRKILRCYSYTSRLPEGSPPIMMLEQGYIGMFARNIIITTTTLQQDDSTGTKPTHELSLFGVMLCLVMRLWRKSASESYYDKIALNYRVKLPLIFGKWNQLKAIFKEYAYYNFDIILDREIRSNTKDLPSVRKGGNRELIEGIMEIILENKESMSNFGNAAAKMVEENAIRQIEVQIQAGTAKPSDLSRLRGKLHELDMLSDPFLARYPLLSGNVTGVGIGMAYVAQSTHAILKYMEEFFADEISAYYYMNLCTDSYRVSESHCCKLVKPLLDKDKSPKQCLALLLEQDKEEPLIKEWFLKWIEDLKSQQSDLSDEEQKLLDNFKAIV
jgi:hypothetical protein